MGLFADIQHKVSLERQQTHFQSQQTEASRPTSFPTPQPRDSTAAIPTPFPEPEQERPAPVEPQISPINSGNTAAAIQRIKTDVERITRRNMKDAVADYLAQSCSTNAELRGSVPGMPFKGMVQGSNLTSFFWFQPFVPASHPDTIYICEGAIDAISLYCIHDALLTRDDMLGNMYCSIGGVANQQRIDAIKKQFPGVKIVIAVDNDLAGQQCRDRNQDCWTCVPTLKDWNDDWRTYYTSFHDMQSQA